MWFCFQYETTDAVDGFLILYKPFSGDDDSFDDYQRHTVSDARLRRAKISGLLPDTSYSFRMQCYNGAGQSEMSNASVKKTLGVTMFVVLMTFIVSASIRLAVCAYLCHAGRKGAMGKVLCVFRVIAVNGSLQSATHFSVAVNIGGVVPYLPEYCICGLRRKKVVAKIC